MKNPFEELTTKFINLSQREKIALTVGAVVVMVFLFTEYGIRPNLKRVSEIKSTIEIKSQDVEIAQAEGVSLPALQREYKRLTDKIEGFEAKIPKETKADVFVDNLTKIADDNGASIKSLKSGIGIEDATGADTNKEGEYVRFSTEISLLSEPKELVNFLDALAAMPRLVCVKEFEIDADERLSPEISARLLVTTYSME